MISLSQKGNVLLYAVVAMTAISVLGTGIYFMTTTSTFGGLRANQQNRAYQLALAGKDYALTRNLGNTATLYPSGRDFTFASGDKFRLVISGDTITSTGIVNENTPYEARRTVTVTQSGFGSRADISFPRDIADMGIIQPTSAPADFISKTASQISLGKIGASYQSQFGAVVYSGNVLQGNCVAGKCAFGTGFNAFFVFQFASGSTGDGFTFAFFNGSNNNKSSVGGYAGWGELLGYGGNSYVSPGYYLDTPSGHTGYGIQPPKVAVEFDPFQNAANALCNSDSRYDAARNHMALMFWGDNTTYCNLPVAGTVGKNTFDDNRHGAGTDGVTEPMNAKSPLQAGWNGCYYFNGDTQCTGGALGWLTNWLLNAPDNVYAIRTEVSRSLTPAGGPYTYRIKTWLRKCGSGDLTCALYDESSNLANLKIGYTDSSPTLDRTIQLDETNHQAFNTMLFGWTTATGGATQQVSINRFKLNFLK